MNFANGLRRLHQWLIPPESSEGALAYVWLVYLFLFFVSPIFMGLPAEDNWRILGVTALFLPLYFRVFHARPRELLLIMLAMVLLGVWMAPYYIGAAVFFIYAACFAPGLDKARYGAVAVVVIALLGGLTGWLIGVNWFMGLIAGLFALVNGGLNIHMAEMDKKNRALRLSQQEVRHLATTAERERIARDLHDLMGHTLSVLALKSELACRLIERDPPRARAELEELQRISRSALSEVREAVSGYRKSCLSEELASARLALESADIRFDYHLPDAPLGERDEGLLAMVVREASTNVLRHSGASRCQLSFNCHGKTVELDFSDNGCAGAVNEGNGMRGIRERVEQAGGDVKWFAENGLRLQVRLPMEQTA